MADKLIYIPNNDTQNDPFSRLKLVVETNKNKQQQYFTKRKRYCKFLETSVINSPLSTLSLSLILGTEFYNSSKTIEDYSKLIYKIQGP